MIPNNAYSNNTQSQYLFSEYGTYGCSQDQERLSSFEETSTTETENTVDIPYISGTEEDVSSHCNYQNDDHEEEFNIDIKKEANTDSRYFHSFITYQEFQIRQHFAIIYEANIILVNYKELANLNLL